MMKVFVLNLDRDKERLEAVDKQLRRLGVEYERITAVYGKSLSAAEKNSKINRFRWWCAVGRPYMPGEVGCALSHFKAWESCETAVCVLEDDVILALEFPAVLERVGKWISPAKPQVVLLSNHSGETGKGVCRSSGDMYAEGYVINLAAIKALRACNDPLQTPCDWWGRWARRGVIELYHAFPTVCSQNQSQYESGTVQPGCLRVSELSLLAFAWHKLKRLIGKVLDRILPL